MHLDGDAFFVSVEAAKDPRLRGRPVVTGQERGIASAMSYEAKALGITRAMPIFQIRRQFPQVAVVDSDYESYAVFSKRMMDIVRRYTDVVEEYSIDECFADFTDVPGFKKDPLPVLSRLKGEIGKELGISVSLGLASTKSLAKMASKSKKPDGLTIVCPEDVTSLLGKTPVDKVWGIGSATAISLRKKGITTALDLASKPAAWVSESFSKPLEEMHLELNGVSVHPVATGSEPQRSIMKTRTFFPASDDSSYVFSELSKNLEGACRRARELGLYAKDVSVYLKTKDLSYANASRKLSLPSNGSFQIVREAKKAFDEIFERGRLYRATGAILCGLVPEEAVQEDLFGGARAAEKGGKVLEAVDRINKKYGKSLVHMASSSRSLHRERRREKKALFMPRGSSKRLSVPYLGEAR